MARIRSLKPDFFDDEDLAVHPFWVRILFQGLWCHADKEGRLEDRPIKLKPKIFPYDDNIDIDEGLRLLTQPKIHSPKHPPFIVRYEVEGNKYIQILNFEKHQSPHHTERESEIPAYNGEISVNEPVEKGASQDAHYPKSITPKSITPKSKKRGSGGIRLILDESPKRWDGITDEDKALWAKTYPGCDVEVILQEMIAYWDAQPPAKRKLNWKRTIVNRLKWVQDHGGSNKSSGGVDLDAWAAKGAK